MKLIISIDNIREFRPIAKDIPEDRILPYIREAQQYELKQLLGDALYYDFLLRFDNQADGKYNDYQALLNGKSYPWGVQTIEHPGLIPYMSYHTLSKFYTGNPLNVTKYGIVTKIADQSEAIDARVLAAEVAALKSNALADQADIIKYLTNNGTLYPLYVFQDGSALGQNSVGFFDPDRPKAYARNGRTLTSF
jgi:hypothetical protein